MKILLFLIFCLLVPSDAQSGNAKLDELVKSMAREFDRCTNILNERISGILEPIQKAWDELKGKTCTRLRDLPELSNEIQNNAMAFASANFIGSVRLTIANLFC
ncbi:hypothetical protein B9Z55_003341 [Caenorhabditis nigoni]|uniref:SXP/RAL-2 family protein Ani s 5-like cation-binding domain-containing protein n=1 Tax=Caenorhabditis nigoni TaxID=1611254 RepID=A0A2G5VPP6_9PELO|nr:hypothetical protein B9Z55_003341 [Caenorhabditis nigoni]